MILASILLLFVVVYLCGSKVSVDTSYTVPDLPADLDEYLKIAEARFSDITPGAEKVIHWAHSDKRKTPIAFLYFHGFSATRQESMPVPEDVARHFGCNIFYTRLTGNGRSDDAMVNGTVNTWVNDASEAMAIASEIGERTVIIGCSTGATLAWWISNQEPFIKQTAALVFMSPNFGTADPRGTLLTARWGRQLAEAIIGDYREGEAVSETHARYWSVRYPTRALLPMMGMVKVARRIKPALCKRPVLILYSPYDDTVDARKIQKFYRKLPCVKNIIAIDNPHASSQHVIVGDILSPQNNQLATDSIIDFLEENTFT